jgi:hypothetical protein
VSNLRGEERFNSRDRRTRIDGQIVLSHPSDVKLTASVGKLRIAQGGSYVSGGTEPRTTLGATEESLRRQPSVNPLNSGPPQQTRVSPPETEGEEKSGGSRRAIAGIENYILIRNLSVTYP